MSMKLNTDIVEKKIPINMQNPWMLNWKILNVSIHQKP